jgi:lipid-binding SYLF domain-containing protein
MAYYGLAAASVGLLAGAQQKKVYMRCMRQDAMQKFERSEGWTAGADACFVLFYAAADARVDTASAHPSIISYVLDSTGLMANLSIDGTKFTEMDQYSTADSAAAAPIESAPK